MKRGDKKAQVTIFIILALMVVAIGILLYMFYPQIKASFGFEEISPYGFMQSCLKERVEEVSKEISIHGGSIEPVFPYKYQGEEFEYLCYTNEYYKLCTVQQAFLINHIEEEIKSSISRDVDECFNELKKKYESKGYGVILRKGDFSVNLLPKRISVNSETEISLKKDQTEYPLNTRVLFSNYAILLHFAR